MIEARDCAWRAEDERPARVRARADARELLDGMVHGRDRILAHRPVSPDASGTRSRPGPLISMPPRRRGRSRLDRREQADPHALWQALASRRARCCARLSRGHRRRRGRVARRWPTDAPARTRAVSPKRGIVRAHEARIAFKGRDYGQRAIVAHVTTERPHEGAAWQRFQPGGPLAFLPLADGRCSIVWSLPDAEAARILALDDAAFRAELGCAFDFRLGEITATTKRAAFPLRLRLAERFVQDRCVLAGDAAHVVHPLAGQGMNLAFRDVRALRSILRAARERGGDIGAAHVLRRYERERRSESTLAAYGLDAICRVFGSDSMLPAAIRGVGLSAADLQSLRRVIASAAAGWG